MTFEAPVWPLKVWSEKEEQGRRGRVGTKWQQPWTILKGAREQPTRLAQSRGKELGVDCL